MYIVRFRKKPIASPKSKTDLEGREIIEDTLGSFHFPRFSLQPRYIPFWSTCTFNHQRWRLKYPIRFVNVTSQLAGALVPQPCWGQSPSCFNCWRRALGFLSAHDTHGRAIPTMSLGPLEGQAVGTMGWHMTTLSPRRWWPSATARTRQDKTASTASHRLISE